MLEQYKEEIGALLGVPTAAEIEFFYQKPEDGRILLGQYDYTRSKLRINTFPIYHYSAADSYDLLETIRHEMRHAYQYAATAGMYRYGYINVYGEDWDTMVQWDLNIDNYISPDEDRFAYEEQVIEVDARNFSGEQ